MSETASGRRRQVNRLGYASAAVTMAFAGLTALSPAPATAETLLSESFKNASTPLGDWTATSPQGSHAPCLTAAGSQPPLGSLSWCKAVHTGKAKADPPGSGAFQITDNAKGDAGGLILERSLDAKKGLHIEFDQFQYGSSTAKGGDGLSFFLIDGATVNPAVGDSGGWLGYRNLKGAIVGVGFDQFGNFSNNKFWGTAGQPDKGPGKKANSVVVRGSQSTNFQYVTGKSLAAVQPLAVDGAKSRDEARRSVAIDVSTAGFMKVSMDFHDGKGRQPVLTDVNLNKIPGQAELPDKIKLGFAASTGSSTNNHEIQNFKVATLDPNLTTVLAPQGAFQRGGTGNVEINVANQPGGGPTNGPITTTFTAPQGLTITSVSGDGWLCTTFGPKATCLRPGDGVNALPPGAAAPGIKVALAVAADVPEKAFLEATTTVPNDNSPDDNTSQPTEVLIARTDPGPSTPEPTTAPTTAPEPTTVPTVPVPPAGQAGGPDLSVKTVVDGAFQPGTKGKTITTVSNSKDAYPTVGWTNLTIHAPAGTLLTTSHSANWNWNCTVHWTRKTATCATIEVIKPGQDFTPIETTYEVPGGTTGKLTIPASTVTTPYEVNAADNTSPTQEVEVAPAAKPEAKPAP